MANVRPVPSAEPAPSPDVVEVYRTHVDRVSRWARRLAGPQADLEDIVQEVFLAVAAQLSGFRGDAKISTWLYAITTNVVRKHRRRERWRRLINPGDPYDELPSSFPTPVETLEKHRAESAVYRVLDKMADKYRDILILFELEGLSGAEISKLTGMPEQTVWVRLHRARKDFEKRMARTPEFKELDRGARHV